MLADVVLCMRSNTDTREAWRSKAEHIAQHRSGDRVVMVDDDPKAELALFKGDILLLAPQQWPMLSGVLGA